MKEVDFLNKITPRVGPEMAVGYLQNTKERHLISLLIKKGVFTASDFNESLSEFISKAADNILSQPVESPIQANGL